MALTLNVPNTENSVLQREAERPAKATGLWLERLPFASPKDAAQQLIAALYTLNRQPMSPEKRYALMVQFSPVVSRVAASLQPLIAGVGVPHSASQQLPGGMLRGLLTEHSIGYKHVLLDLIGQTAGRTSHNQRIADVTARLTAALVDTLAACFQTYSIHPYGLWLELHQLYQFALTRQISNSGAGEIPATSLSYRKALLLALADPPHMNHSEFTHTLTFLDHLGKLALLVPSSEQPSGKGFGILVDQDNGSSRQMLTPKESDLWLDTDALCRQLREIVLRLQAGEPPKKLGFPPTLDSQLGKTLGKYLYKQWRIHAKRAYNRYPAATPSIQLVAGVSAIHQLLRMMQSPAQQIEKMEDSQLIHDVQPVRARPAAVTITLWTITNDSAAGLSLSGTPNAPLNLKVGDALALQTADETEWSLGLIRWVKMHDQQMIGLGVQRLSPRMQPAWVQTMRGRSKGKQEPALLIPEIPALQQAARLLLPRPLYRRGMDAALNSHATTPVMLTFGQCHEHTHSFDLIDFTPFS